MLVFYFLSNFLYWWMLKIFPKDMSGNEINEIIYMHHRNILVYICTYVCRDIYIYLFVTFIESNSQLSKADYVMGPAQGPNSGVVQGF